MEIDTLIFSEAIKAFLLKATSFARSILLNEMQIQVGRTRFYYKGSSYPLRIVAFEHPTQLGYFKGEFYEIGLNKRLILKDETFLKNILRHELAHYITSIENGPLIKAHGKEFQAICKLYGWGKEVSLAFQKLNPIEEEKNEKVFGKIQKLLSLSKSPNKEEAKAALLKAQTLATEHNLNAFTSPSKSDQDMFVKRLFQVKKVSAKLEAISTILRHFFVYPVFNRGKGIVYLEVFGEKANVIIATHVAYFLEKELERLWKDTKELSGYRSKNSFFKGIAVGYKGKKATTIQEKNSLIILKQTLTQKLKVAYPHLSSISCKHKVDKKAKFLGKERGKKLRIREGVIKKMKCLITLK